MKKCLTFLVVLGGLAPAAAFAEQQAIAILRSTSQMGATPAGKVIGYAWLSQAADSVKVYVEAKGLAPNSVHGFHVHEYGDLSAADASSAGGHFNPTGATHGGPQEASHHVGDLGNLRADENGNIQVTRLYKFFSLRGDRGVVGRALVLHANADDLDSQPSGDSGDRIAAGVIATAGERYGVSPAEFTLDK